LQPAKKKKSSPKEKRQRHICDMLYVKSTDFLLQEGNFLKFCENFGVETSQKVKKHTPQLKSQSPEHDKREKKSSKVWKKKMCACVRQKNQKNGYFVEVNSFFHTFDILKRPSLF
jgi:hypothetical protein